MRKLSEIECYAFCIKCKEVFIDDILLRELEIGCPNSDCENYCLHRNLIVDELEEHKKAYKDL